MSRRGHAYPRMILKNITLFLVVFLLLSSLITLGQLRLKRGEIDDTYAKMLKLIQGTPSLQEKARSMGMNESEYAWYLTYKILNVKPTFWESFKYYFKGTVRIFEVKETTKGWGITFYLQNTFSILIIAEAMILIFGLYLGLRAGYNGGLTEKLVSTLAPFFSAIPAWFLGTMILLVLWSLGHSPSFWINIQQASASGNLNALTYVKYYLPPAFTLFLAMVWEYAFSISTFIKEEKESYHVVADVTKGLPDGRIRKKLLRVALPSFLTYTTYNFVDMLMSLLVVELVFDVPGLGYLLASSFRVIHKEPDGVYLIYHPQLIFFVSLVILLLYTLNSILMEGLYIYLDPRISRRD